jgi:DNA-binding GntR family transcriptional regulator
MVTMVSQDDAEEARIVERIYEAVMDQRLAPGAKLSEAALCEAFGVGRMRIRRSLLILASREVVELQPNRGAYVAQPTADQAREVFEARLLIEPPLARLAAQRIKRVGIKALALNLDKEAAAHAAGNRRDVEHNAIVASLRAGNADQAEALMRAHLGHIKDHLQPGRQTLQTHDLVALFSNCKSDGKRA